MAPPPSGTPTAYGFNPGLLELIDDLTRRIDDDDHPLSTVFVSDCNRMLGACGLDLRLNENEAPGRYNLFMLLFIICAEQQKQIDVLKAARGLQ